MRCERLRLSGDPASLAEELRGLVAGSESVRETVEEIVAAVRSGGDGAVLEYTQRLDTAGTTPQPLLIAPVELEQALERLDGEVTEALRRAVSQVEQVSALALEAGTGEVHSTSHTVKLRRVPVRRAAVYVPGGRAPYPSTVIMGVVPARCAGVAEISVCSPPGPDGDLHPAILAACRLAGASTVYRMGGAQAIAALAYGTESVSPVDVIVGPGNLYVQEAKRQLYGQVGVDGFAGPSDLVVIADPGADAELICLDLLAQAEHGSGTIVVAMSSSAALLDAVQAGLAGAADTGAVAALVVVDEARDALALSEAFAPEHLQLVGQEAEALAEQVRQAGCLFLGAASGTAFGDYIAGSNHILPTQGTARFASGVSPNQFLRTMAHVTITEPSELAVWGAAIARAEGFTQHARSMEARIRQNRSDV